MFLLSIIVLIDLMGISIIIPIFPLLQDLYGFTPANIGYVVVIFSFFMIVGSLFFGILSDRYGRKYALIIPLFGAAVAYFWTSQSDSITTFLIGRMFSGFFAGSYSVAFAISADLSNKENRMKNMTVMGAMIGLSFVIGPMLGGNISHIVSFYGGASFSNNMSIEAQRHIAEIPFIFSAILSLLSGFLALGLFKETYYPDKTKSKSSSKVLFKNFITAYSNPNMLFSTIMNMVLTAVLSGIQIYLGIWMSHKFNVTTQYLGYFWSFTAVIMIISQGIIRLFFYKVSPTKISTFSWISFALGLIALSYSSSVMHLYLSAVLLYVSLSFLQSAINTSVSLGGSDDQQGLIFGINQAINGLGRVIGPNIIGMMIVSTSFSTTWLCLAIVAIIMSASSYLVAKKYINNI